MQAPGAPAVVFTALAEMFYSHDDPFDVYRAVVDAAPLLVSGVDHASLMLRHHGRYLTVAATDDIGREIDEVERSLGEGPCLDAITRETAELNSDLTVDPTWPRLADHLLEHTPVRGAAGFRVVVDGDKVGALNLWSDAPDRLDERSMDEAAVLAAFASVAVTAFRQREEAADLRRALETNREIGKAVGLLMAFHRVSDDEALEILRRTSQDLNLKLARVASEVVEHHAARVTTE